MASATSPSGALGDGFLDGVERIVDRTHEHLALRLHHQHPLAVACLDQHGASAGRARQKIDRPDQRRFAHDVGNGVALVPGMIAQRHRIGTGIPHRMVVPLGQPAAMAGVLGH